MSLFLVDLVVFFMDRCVFNMEIRYKVRHFRSAMCFVSRRSMSNSKSSKSQGRTILFLTGVRVGKFSSKLFAEAVNTEINCMQVKSQEDEDTKNCLQKEPHIKNVCL